MSPCETGSAAKSVDWAERFSRWTLVLRELHGVAKALRQLTDELMAMRLTRVVLAVIFVLYGPGDIGQQVIDLLR